MCGLRDHRAPSHELGLEEIRTVARHLADIGACHLVITGGEPFLRPDLADVIAAFAAHDFSIRIQTNGGPQVTRERLTECVQAGLHDLSVSIDSLDESLQDRICQAPNVVENALRTLALAAELMPKGMHLANVAASRFNFEELPALVRFFNDRGLFTHITPVMCSDETVDDRQEYQFRSSHAAFSIVDLTPRARDRVIDELVRLRRRGLGLTNSSRFLEDWRRDLASGNSHRRCKAGKLSVDVLPDGGVSICKEKPVVDNILDPEFVVRYRRGEFHERTEEMTRSCCGCYYAEYREPYYAVHDLFTLAEWMYVWLRFYRGGATRNRCGGFQRRCG
jgi:MoaA/NifB/PqqE/SkfB family radical SAM enzyme